jgi:hypothetical protein
MSTKKEDYEKLKERFRPGNLSPEGLTALLT